MNRRLNEQELEQFVHRTLRSLPNRRAPGTLEARVLAEVARRASIPWWHKSYAYWPAPVRIAFLGFATAVTTGIVFVLFTATHSEAGAQVAGEVSRRFEWISLLHAFGAGAVEKTRVVLAAIPPLWFYGALGFIGACYATLLGVGAVAYRTLSSHRSAF